ncbi:uncharacterized protein LOC118203190 [Stegodyphus dumicola]|uniref:uncharacterized protein LOC118203190 n=1 Tax=Stegodyphus dumicola TaxID=202533 RepID=UPI0015AF1E77|nr:uncharacterized protein LOC118203190 [Stegodyphus dumicola]
MDWILMGKLFDRIENGENVTNAVAVTSLLIHTSEIENLWKLDLLGIQDPVETKCRKEMKIAALNHFNQTVTFKEGRYEIQLPWVTEKDCLSQNLDIAKQRLNSTTHRLIQKGKFEDYENVFTDDWLNEGIIKEVPEHEMNNQCHYLLHKGVFKETSTMKLRPVFDASCKDKNSRSLEKGPNLLEQIIPIILRFRKNRIGVISDIRKAFLKMSVNKSDRDFLRFLWWKDFDKEEFRVFRHKRVVFGLNCSPFLLAAVLSHHIDLNSSKYPETAENLKKKSFYVDNCITSVPDEETLTQFIEESKQVLDSASFDLRGWEHTSLLKSEDSIEPTPVLGILWDKEDDSLFCEVKTDTYRPVNLTRRNILSAVHRIFDPMVFVCPITLTPKLLIQKTWLLKTGWNTNIPEDLGKEFYSWIDDLSLLSSIRIPRALDVNGNESLSLHTYCDASKQAYGCVIYLRKETSENVSVYFLLAKSRVSLLRKMTIKRLELLSCCIGVRFAALALQTLKLDNVPRNYWTDSSTALSWIKRDDHWAPFVANRVKEIRKLSSESEWRHIPGNSNPADIPSRGCSIKSFVKSRWWQGPECLMKNEKEWPTSEVITNEEEIMKEKRKNIISTLANITAEKWYLICFSSLKL